MNGSYKSFLEAEYARRKPSLYERLCRTLSIIPVSLPKGERERIKSEIEFCHLRITPEEVFSFSITAPLIFLFLSFLTLNFLGLLSFTFVFMCVVLSLLIFFYLYTYTNFMTKYFRVKASTEMSLAVIYMAISLRINKSLESAVTFAAQNLTGPLGMDLRKMMWDVGTGKLLSVSEGLEWLSRKWKEESEEFVNAISILKSAVDQPPTVLEKSVREAVDLMKYGTKERMKKYALNLRNPLRIINAFGILLPMIVLILFPTLVLFLPSVVSREIIIFTYVFLLPMSVYLFLRKYLFTKPYSYHQSRISETKRFKSAKRIGLILSTLFLISSLFFLKGVVSSEKEFSDTIFLQTLAAIVLISFSMITFTLVSSFRFLSRNEDIRVMESELPVSLLQLSTISSLGKPVEKGMEELLPKITGMRIKKFFEEVVYNMRSFGMTLEESIFDEKVGVMKKYPSRVIANTFRMLVSISKKGMSFLSVALKSFSEFLKDADEINNDTEEILSETTSNMQIQALVFAPLSAGIVVGLMAIVMNVLVFFGSSMEGIGEIMGETGFEKTITSPFLASLLSVGKEFPFHTFHLTIGIYMILMVLILSYFLSGLSYGDDEVRRMFEMGKMLTIGLLVYVLTVSLIYFGISKMISLEAMI
ncbi:MAG: hypothetical protein ACTSVF_01570 [Candidatus Asgardarchaeia archaeon]